MEKELKVKSAKNTATKENAQPKKYTYEELNNLCAQLHQQNQMFARRLMQMEQNVMFKRLEFLFKAVELSDKISDAEFISNCIDEIKVMMTPVEDSEEGQKASPKEC